MDGWNLEHKLKIGEEDFEERHWNGWKDGCGKSVSEVREYVNGGMR